MIMTSFVPRDSLSAQLELAMAKAESEELARQIAEEQVLEKSKLDCACNKSVLLFSLSFDKRIHLFKQGNRGSILYKYYLNIGYSLENLHIERLSPI